jgi:hypothetical protein
MVHDHIDSCSSTRPHPYSPTYPSRWLSGTTPFTFGRYSKPSVCEYNSAPSVLLNSGRMAVFGACPAPHSADGETEMGRKPAPHSADQGPRAQPSAAIPRRSDPMRQTRRHSTGRYRQAGVINRADGPFGSRSRETRVAECGLATSRIRARASTVLKGKGCMWEDRGRRETGNGKRGLVQEPGNWGWRRGLRTCYRQREEISRWCGAGGLAGMERERRVWAVLMPQD